MKRSIRIDTRLSGDRQKSSSEAEPESSVFLGVSRGGRAREEASTAIPEGHSGEGAGSSCHHPKNPPRSGILPDRMHNRYLA